MADKEALSARLGTLKPELDRTLRRERGAVEAQGKPFDLSSWLLGSPIDQKYPSGPMYPVRGRERAVPCDAARGGACGAARRC